MFDCIRNLSNASLGGSGIESVPACVLPSFTSTSTPTIVATGSTTALDTATVGVELSAYGYETTTPAGASFTFEWESSTAASGQAWSPIVGATNETFTATSDLAGSFLRVKVTANKGGYSETSTASIGLEVFAAVTAPGAPTSLIAVAGSSLAIISFNAPISNGGAVITSYTVISLPGGFTATGSDSPIIFTGLTNGTSYRFIVTATNSAGRSKASLQSNAVTPAAPPPPLAITSLDVTHGPRLGSTAVTITGTGFAVGATVNIGGNNVTVNTVTATTISVTTSAHDIGVANVIVTNTDNGTVTSTGAFRFDGVDCDGSFTCVVGDRGPGGGIVYYYSASAFACGPTLATTCHYLEAAPTTGVSPWIETRYQWSVDTSNLIGTASAIGSGYKNTLAMNAQNSTAGKAGTISRAFRGPNNLTDWYLPSQDELNQMCKWALGIAWVSDTTPCGPTTPVIINSGGGAAGFVGDFYWSSSQSSDYGGIYAFYQFFGNGFQDRYFKNSTYYVRPVRAF
jgi:hypothetical protein